MVFYFCGFLEDHGNLDHENAQPRAVTKSQNDNHEYGFKD